MQDISDRLIVALDVSTLKEAKHFVDRFYSKVKLFKVGSQLFTACGPDAVKMIGEKGGRVFLDLKFHDIPNTVSSAVASGTGLGCVFMMTVHAQGGPDMMKAAVRAAEEISKDLRIKKPYIVGVTVLTSDEGANAANLVLERAKLAQEAGLDGVVCSAHEAAAVRKACGRDFIIVTPGIRPKAAAADDQKRTATAQEALAAGSSYLVVGRPILHADDPLRAVEELL